jgi:hypothetical protein
MRSRSIAAGAAFVGDRVLDERVFRVYFGAI